MSVTCEAIQPILKKHGARIRDIDGQVSKISIVGAGMADQVGVAQQMFSALANADIPIQLITTSEIKLSVLVPRSKALEALRLVHACFKLDEAPQSLVPITPKRDSNIDAVQVVDRLREVGIEGLVIDEIQVDTTQACLTINRVPNRAEPIANLFEQLADGGVFIDMIVEGYEDQSLSDISFTVPKTQLENALSISRAYRKKFACGEINVIESIAKLSVSGIGLRSHTGVAVKTFHALASADIPLVMISTSEIRVNVVVPGEFAETAQEKIEKEFEANQI